MELVDKNSRELLLQVVADCRLSPDEVARACQEIRVIERAGRLLQRLISGRRTRQFLLQARGKVGIRPLPKLVKMSEQRVAGRQHGRAEHVLAELVAAALSGVREAPIAHEIDEPRLPAIQVALAE